MLPVTDHEAPDFTGKKIENCGVPHKFPVEHEATIFQFDVHIRVVLIPLPVP